MNIKKSFSELIGNTPLLQMDGFSAYEGIRANLLAKLEYFNPTGSAKDRPAYEMIYQAEKSGKIGPGAVIIEPTSGNTGIGLAAVCAARGYRAIIVMPDTMSVERRQLMAAYGAEVVLTPGSDGMSGAIKKADELAAVTPNSFIPQQFSNSDNALAHYKTTGPEIWRDTEGNVDVLIATVGTGGTLTGTARYLREHNPNIEVIAVEPASSPLLSEGRMGSHKIQGIGANFIPDVLDRSVYNRVIPVSDDDAYKYAALAAKTEGVLVGISSGAALCAAAQTAALPQYSGKNIVVILPDTGERYLSTPGFIEV